MSTQPAWVFGNKENRVGGHNRIQQGRVNANRILDCLDEHSVMSAELIHWVTGIPRGTVDNQLTRLAGLGRVRVVVRGQHEPYLYRSVTKGNLKILAEHELGLAEDWAALNKGAAAKQIKIEPTLPTEFESSKGKTIPDKVFSCTASSEQRFFTWEHDRGRQQDPGPNEKKFICMWWWRKEFCHDTDLALKRWGINKGIRVLTSSPNEKRLEQMRKFSWAAHPAGKRTDMFYFTHRGLWTTKEPQDPKEYYSRFQPEKLYEPIWVTAKDDRLRSILE